MTIRLTTLLCIFLFIACTSSKTTVITKAPYLQERFLIITADDFGASKNINEGIKFAAENKAINSISVLSNFNESLSDLKEISDNNSDIGIGVHLNIITGKPILDAEQVPSLVTANGSFYTINLDSALQNDHLISEQVVDKQNTDDRRISAGTFVKIPANNISPEIEYTILRDVVVPAGGSSYHAVGMLEESAGAPGLLEDLLKIVFVLAPVSPSAPSCIGITVTSSNKPVSAVSTLTRRPVPVVPKIVEKSSSVSSLVFPVPER